MPSKKPPELEEDLRVLLRGCSLSARGLFREMRDLIDQEARRLRAAGQKAGRPGHLRWNGRPMSDKQLANLAGCSPDEASQATRELLDSGIVGRDSEGTYHSSLLTRIAEGRDRHARAQRAYEEKGPGERVAAGRGHGDRVSDDPPSDPRPDPVLIRPPAPSPVLSPKTPLLSPTLDPHFPAAAASGPAGGPPAGRGEVRDEGTAADLAGGDGAEAGPARRRKAKSGGKRERKLTDEQLAVWTEFRRWYADEAWPPRHGGEVYPFGDKESGHGDDGPQSLTVCKRGKWDLAVIRRVAEAWLAEPEIYGNYDHKLRTLAMKFNGLRRRLDQQGGRAGPATGPPSPSPGQPMSAADKARDRQAALERMRAKYAPGPAGPNTTEAT